MIYDYFWAEAVTDRIRLLESVIERTEKSLKKVPKGQLKITGGGRRIQYYLKEADGDGKYHYLPQKKHDLARKAAQRDYDREVNRLAREEIAYLEEMLLHKPAKVMNEVFESLPWKRKLLVEPLCVSDEVFVEQWLSQDFSGKEMDSNEPTFTTEKGERVRSKSELLIANALHAMNIPYYYEKPLNLNGQTVYPDFTVLNVKKRSELIWEHLGMLDSFSYFDRNLPKLLAYQKEGYRLGEDLIFTFETSKAPLSTAVIKQTIKNYLI